MMAPASLQQQVIQLLCEWRGGDPGALEKLIQLVGNLTEDSPKLQPIAVS